MEDLTGKIAEILSDPETMNTIKGLTGLLDSSERKKTDEESGENKEETENDENSTSGFSFSPELMQMMLKIVPLLSSMNKEDKYTRFLDALRPLLSEKKRKKLDTSSKLLQLVRILPILKGSGIL